MQMDKLSHYSTLQAMYIEYDQKKYCVMISIEHWDTLCRKRGCKQSKMDSLPHGQD